MIVVEQAGDMQARIGQLKRDGWSVGLVPTMGFFHEGHLSLMRAARENDVVVVSLFVNPAQFGPGEDLAAYPRDLERDLKMAESVGVDIVFHPAPEEMYPEPFLTHVDVERVTAGLCGRSRPGHFRGVTTVVTKLLHIIPADRAYFGQKDAQQLAVIRQMVRDLNMDIEVVACPIIREPDGLAMSSRNAYLGDAERRAATVLHRSLREAERLVESGERRATEIEAAVHTVFKDEPLAQLEYIEVCDNIGMQPIAQLEGTILVAVAAKIGGSRLIDNVLLKVED